MTINERAAGEGRKEYPSLSLSLSLEKLNKKLNKNLPYTLHVRLE